MRLLQEMPDGTIAPYGYQHAKRMAVDDTRQYRLGETVQLDGQTYEITLIDHIDGVLGIAVWTNDWPGKETPPARF